MSIFKPVGYFATNGKVSFDDFILICNFHCLFSISNHSTCTSRRDNKKSWNTRRNYFLKINKIICAWLNNIIDTWQSNNFIIFIHSSGRLLCTRFWQTISIYQFDRIILRSYWQHNDNCLVESFLNFMEN